MPLRHYPHPQPFSPGEKGESSPARPRSVTDSEPFFPWGKGDSSLSLGERVGVRVSGLCKLASRLVLAVQMGH